MFYGRLDLQMWVVDWDWMEEVWSACSWRLRRGVKLKDRWSIQLVALLVWLCVDDFNLMFLLQWLVAKNASADVEHRQIAAAKHCRPW